jgi:polyhydroxyalkanoate synthase subunit PhaC
VINKFYIMEIAPGRSMIEYLVQQGQQVFVISWRNPQARDRGWGFDTYGAAIVEALGAVQKIAGTDSAHLLATCAGGILAAMVVAHLAEVGEGDRIAGLTLAVTVLDESRAGLGSAVMSELAAHAAIRVSARKGYLDGRAMAEMFAWLRPIDLVWRYWVNNYVQGRKRPRSMCCSGTPIPRGCRRAASRHGADGAAQLARHAGRGQHAGQPGGSIADHRRRLRDRRHR